jgi:hypothetical protein
MVALIATIGGGIASLIASATAKLSIETLKLIAIKALVLFVVCVVLPIVLYNTMSDLLFDLINYAINYIAGTSISPATIELTGFAGYIGQHIGIQNIVAMYMTAVATRFQLSILRIF